MTRIARLSAALLLALLAVPLEAIAQPRPPAQEPSGQEPAAVAAELGRLNATLERIAGLLERQLQGQRLDLMLKRVDGASRQVDALEGELGRLRSGRSSLVDERFRMQSRLEAMVTEVEHSDPEALPAYEAMSREAERGLKHLDTRIAETDARILELENELARRSGDLQALQDRLDRELDGLQ
jgi:chromosome segregation ATPase